MRRSAFALIALFPAFAYASDAQPPAGTGDVPANPAMQTAAPVPDAGKVGAAFGGQPLPCGEAPAITNTDVSEGLGSNALADADAYADKLGELPAKATATVKTLNETYPIGEDAIKRNYFVAVCQRLREKGVALETLKPALANLAQALGVPQPAAADVVPNQPAPQTEAKPATPPAGDQVAIAPVPPATAVEPKAPETAPTAPETPLPNAPTDIQPPSTPAEAAAPAAEARPETAGQPTADTKVEQAPAGVPQDPAATEQRKAETAAPAPAAAPAPPPAVAEAPAPAPSAPTDAPATSPASPPAVAEAPAPAPSAPTDAPATPPASPPAVAEAPAPAPSAPTDAPATPPASPPAVAEAPTPAPSAPTDAPATPPASPPAVAEGPAPAPSAPADAPATPPTSPPAVAEAPAPAPSAPADAPATPASPPAVAEAPAPAPSAPANAPATAPATPPAVAEAPAPAPSAPADAPATPPASPPAVAEAPAPAPSAPADAPATPPTSPPAVAEAPAPTPSAPTDAPAAPPAPPPAAAEAPAPASPPAAAPETAAAPPPAAPPRPRKPLPPGAGQLSDDQCQALGVPANCADLNSVLAQLLDKPLEFNRPQTMFAYRKSDLGLVLRTDWNGRDMPADVAEELKGLPGEVGRGLTKITRVMSAELSGSGFDIAPSGRQERTIVIPQPVSWSWQVTPKESGPGKTLKLQLYAHLEGPNDTMPPVLLRTLDTAITVDVKTWDWVMAQIRSMQPVYAIIAVMLALLTVVLTYFYTQRTESAGPGRRKGGPVIGDLDQNGRPRDEA